MMRLVRRTSPGYALLSIVVFVGIASYMLMGLASWAGLSIRASRQTFDREQALQIAEAGVDYYRWHLAHAAQDFQDGTGQPGPYEHEVADKDGTVIGRFRLMITAPPVGSSLVVVSSTGLVDANPRVSRTVATRLAKSSLARYAIAANDVMRFGAGTEIFGPIHSNNGIRFDGLAHNIISSAVASYDDPDHIGSNEFGIHTHITPVDPLPPASVPSRTDVFEVGREFPVPAVDFAGITSDLAQMRTDAQASGFYRAGSGANGYHVVLRTDDTFQLYSVTSLIAAPAGCTNSSVPPQIGWGTWSVNNQTLLGTYAFPTNGLIFLEDHVYVDGQINGARLTIVAAVLPDSPPTRRNITINNDLLYTNYDGSDVIGLIAQNNINVGLVSDTDLRVDAALIAQNGRVGRHYYLPPSWFSSRCSPYHTRSVITLYGAIATSLRYGFGYTDGTGYQTRNITYDANLLYGPPPGFPLTSDEYTTISWEEAE